MTTAEQSGGRTRRRGAETRAHILEVAAELFYWDGIRATGIDAVVARAGVAPTTLYRLFSSKDELAAAYVERCSEFYREQLTVVSSPTGGSARDRILAVFDVFTEVALSDACRGCPFLMALTEYPDPDSPVHVAAVAHKAWLRELFRRLTGQLAAETVLADPDGLAEELMLVADGIYGSVQSLGPGGPARFGRRCAENLIRTATRS